MQTFNMFTGFSQASYGLQGSFCTMVVSGPRQHQICNSIRSASSEEIILKAIISGLNLLPAVCAVNISTTSEWFYEMFIRKFQTWKESNFKDVKFKGLLIELAAATKTRLLNINKFNNKNAPDGCVECRRIAVEKIKTIDITTKVFLYSDGSFLPHNGNKGGYGTILRRGEFESVICGGKEKCSDNNEMELMAVVEGLRNIVTPSLVHIVSDSKYVVDGISTRLINWVNTQFHGVRHKELWKELASELERHRIEVHWVKGHSGHKENERCDKLARIAAIAQ